MENFERAGMKTEITSEKVHLFVFMVCFECVEVYYFFLPLKNLFGHNLWVLFLGGVYFISILDRQRTQSFPSWKLLEARRRKPTSFCALIRWQLVLSLKCPFSLFSLNIEVTYFKIKAICLKITSMFIFRAVSFLIVVIELSSVG